MVTYVLNIFNSIFCCLHIWQLQMIFTSQIILDISLRKSVFLSCLNEYSPEKLHGNEYAGKSMESPLLTKSLFSFIKHLLLASMLCILP